VIKLACQPKPGAPKRRELKRSEIEIIRDLAKGRTSIKIARERRCSGAAICQTLRNARRAVKVKTNFELVAYALRKGIIS